MPPKNAHCLYCSKALPSQNAVRLHISATLSCNKTWKKQFSQENSKPPQDLPLKTHNKISPLTPSLSEVPTDDEMDTIADNFNLPSTPAAPLEAIGEDITSLSSHLNNFEGDLHGLHFSEQYPCPIANPIGFQKT